MTNNTALNSAILPAALAAAAAAAQVLDLLTSEGAEVSTIGASVDRHGDPEVSFHVCLGVANHDAARSVMRALGAQAGGWYGSEGQQRNFCADLNGVNVAWIQSRSDLDRSASAACEVS